MFKKEPFRLSLLYVSAQGNTSSPQYFSILFIAIITIAIAIIIIIVVIIIIVIIIITDIVIIIIIMLYCARREG